MATNYANTNDQKLGRFLYVHVQLIGGNKDDAPHTHNRCDSLLKISFYRSNWELYFFFSPLVFFTFRRRHGRVKLLITSRNRTEDEHNRMQLWPMETTS